MTLHVAKEGSRTLTFRDPAQVQLVPVQHPQYFRSRGALVAKVGWAMVCAHSGL